MIKKPHLLNSLSLYHLVFFWSAFTLSILDLKAQMVLEYNTSLSDGTEIALPLRPPLDVTVDWGDGTPVESFITEGDKRHTYQVEGTYSIKINGTLTTFGRFDDQNTLGIEKLVAVKSFGDIEVPPSEELRTLQKYRIPYRIPSRIYLIHLVEH